jgi:hypothetical protein
MEQTFKIYTKNGITPMELMGCIEDGIGKNEVFDVKEVN